MVLPDLSIQAFYQKDLSSFSGNEAFTPDEVEAALRPVMKTWKPKGEYNTVKINELQPGPGRFRFSGRIVSFSLANDATLKNMLPDGFHFLVVKDDTGVVAVRCLLVLIQLQHLTLSQIRLLATDGDRQNLQLGKLVTIWSGVAGQYSGSATFRVPLVSLFVPIYPSEASVSCIKFHDELPNSAELALYRRPLDFDPTKPSSQLPGLMNIKAYLDSGHEGVPDAKLLICISSIGPRRLIKPARKKDNPHPAELELIEVVVFDETASCNLTLWNMASSPRAWIPNQTVLLISNPRYRPADKKRGNGPGLGISIASMVEVNPAFPDADWLRQMALSRTKRECVHIPFPEGVWGYESIVEASERPLFTLAEFDDLARVGGQPMTGKLSLVVLKARIVENHRARKLCCIEWYVPPACPRSKC